MVSWDVRGLRLKAFSSNLRGATGWVHTQCSIPPHPPQSAALGSSTELRPSCKPLTLIASLTVASRAERSFLGSSPPFNTKEMSALSTAHLTQKRVLSGRTEGRAPGHDRGDEKGTASKARKTGPEPSVVGHTLGVHQTMWCCLALIRLSSRHML